MAGFARAGGQEDMGLGTSDINPAMFMEEEEEERKEAPPII